MESGLQLWVIGQFFCELHCGTIVQHTRPVTQISLKHTTTSLRTFSHFSIEHKTDYETVSVWIWRHKATRISCVLPSIWIRIKSIKGPWIDQKDAWRWTELEHFCYFISVCVFSCCLSVCVCVWTVKRTQTGCSSRGGELRGAFGLGGGGQRWGRWLTHKVPAAAINRPVCWFKDEHTGPLTHTRSRCSISDGCFIRRTHTPRMLHGVSAVVHVICTSPAFTKRTSD